VAYIDTLTLLGAAAARTEETGNLEVVFVVDGREENGERER
jgi:hypothetical protein